MGSTCVCFLCECIKQAIMPFTHTFEIFSWTSASIVTMYIIIFIDQNLQSEVLDSWYRHGGQCTFASDDNSKWQHGGMIIKW